MVVVQVEGPEQRMRVVDPVPVGAPAQLPVHHARPHRDYLLRRLLVSADVAGILCALGLAAAYFATGSALSQLFWGFVSLPIFVLLFKAYGLYDRDAKRVSHSTVDDMPWIFHALLVGTLGLWLFFRYGPAPGLDLTEGLGVLRNRARRGVHRARAGPRGQPLRDPAGARALRRRRAGRAGSRAQAADSIREYELEPIGYVDTYESAPDELDVEPRVPRRRRASIDAVCRQAGVERVLILSPEVEPDELADLIRDCGSLDVRISILPHLVDVLGPSVEVDDVEGITVLGINLAEADSAPRGLSSGRWTS